MWDLPGPGIEPVSLALQGRFLTTGPPQKPWMGIYLLSFSPSFDKEYIAKSSKQTLASPLNSVVGEWQGTKKKRIEYGQVLPKWAGSMGDTKPSRETADILWYLRQSKTWLILEIRFWINIIRSMWKRMEVWNVSSAEKWKKNVGRMNGIYLLHHLACNRHWINICYI